MFQASPDGANGPRFVARGLAGVRYVLQWATIVVAAGLGAGLVVGTAAARLAMRTLAATSPDATGRITEAGAVVGDITLEGTVSLAIFAGLPLGLLSAALYALVHRWLPGGWWRPLSFGALLLVLFGAVLEPLRSDNIDFAIVGPDWLSVLLLSFLVVWQGVLVAGIAGRYSAALPPLDLRHWAWYWPLLVAVVLFPIGALIAVAALLAFVVPAVFPIVMRALGSRPGRIAGGAVLVVLCAASLPLLIASIAQIVSG